MPFFNIFFTIKFFKKTNFKKLRIKWYGIESYIWLCKVQEMKTFNFPTNPYIGQIYLDPNYRTWEFDSTEEEGKGKWVDITEYELAPWWN